MLITLIKKQTTAGVIPAVNIIMRFKKFEDMSDAEHNILGSIVIAAVGIIMMLNI